MSLYQQCSCAARRLLDDPGLRMITQGPRGIFTELDVIFLAAREDGPYDEFEMRLVQREASQVMGWMFRQGYAVRYGPVWVPGHKPDYLRSASKIVYAPATGPKTLRTPNGVFPLMTVGDDNIRRPGRRAGEARDDFAKWDITPVEFELSTVTFPHAKPERNKVMQRRRWDEGRSLREIAEEFGISHERVRQITSN